MARKIQEKMDKRDKTIENVNNVVKSIQNN